MLVITQKSNWEIQRQICIPQTFKINNQDMYDKKDISVGFNNFFSKISIQTSQNVPHTNKDCQSYMPSSQQHSIFLNHMLPEH